MGWKWNVTLMRTTFRFVILVLSFLAMSHGSSFAAGKIWVGLYLAENRPTPVGVTLAPEPLHNRLHEVFGFKHYELVKGQEVGLHNEWKQWFVPRQDFFIGVEPLKHAPGEPRYVDYEIYKDGFIVARGKYQPRDGTPLFINGPDFNQGRLIFVLEPGPPKKDDDD
jgi:hypothetical protein